MFRRAAPAVGWLLLLLGGLLAAGGAARAGSGLLVAWPAWPWVAVLLLLSMTLMRSHFEHGRYGWALLPVLALHAAGAPWPGSGALGGPFLLVPILAGVLLGLPAPAWGRRLFLPVVFIVYAAVSLGVQHQVGAEGDEPHYLMVAESLLRDHDLALQDDYVPERYGAFYTSQPTLEPHYLVRGRQGEIYSQHALGLTLLILPAYALAGYPAASLFMACVALLLVRELRALLYAWMGATPVADGVAWLVALSPPLICFAGLIFTEVPAAYVLALSLRHLRRPENMSTGRAWLVGLALAFVPWLNVRYLVLPPLLIAYAATRRPALRRMAALVVPLLVSAGLSALYHYQLYGFFDPRHVYGRRPGFAWGRLPGNLEALLFDQEYGLLVYAPIFALALPGCVALVRRFGWRDALAALLPIAVVLATAATWRMWWGGFTPPARFLVPIVPALALAVAASLRRGLSAATALLAAFGLVIGVAAATWPRLVHRDRDGTAPLFRAVAGAEEWTRLLPGFVLGEDPARHALAGVWALMLLLAIAAHQARRRPASPLYLAFGVSAWIAASLVAGRWTQAVTGGRDAVRVLGRPTLALPAWHWGVVPAAWTTGDVGWGPLYEAHRFPGGASLGLRLPLRAGRYRLRVAGEVLPASAPPLLRIVREPGGRQPLQAMSRDDTGAGWLADFEVPAGVLATSLMLAGGGPLDVRSIRLGLQPSP